MRVLLVPSGGIAPVDSLEGTSTLHRCEGALVLLQTSQFDVLVLSGGQCHGPSIETQSAADTMEGWFESHLVVAPIMLIERWARDTYENISRTVELLRTVPGKHDITVVTHWQHSIRFQITFWLAHRIWVRTKPLHYTIAWKEWVWGWVYVLYHLYDWKGTKHFARAGREGRLYGSPQPGEARSMPTTGEEVWLP